MAVFKGLDRTRARLEQVTAVSHTRPCCLGPSLAQLVECALILGKMASFLYTPFSSCTYVSAFCMSTHAYQSASISSAPSPFATI